MFQAFIVVLRESFESFLIVAITVSYLQKMGRSELIPVVAWGIVCSLLTSAGLGFWLWQGANGPLWEGIFGLVSAVFVLTLVVHMWKTAGGLKNEMETTLNSKTSGKAGWPAVSGVFLFTVFMISRKEWKPHCSDSDPRT
jgi:FTR1 family protein